MLVYSISILYIAPQMLDQLFPVLGMWEPTQGINLFVEVIEVEGWADCHRYYKKIST
jgi:hypothetical protein